MMKVYIAGAITNNPNYREQFEAAEERLKAAGYAVINPCKNEGFTYREYINMGLCELMHCDAIYLLKGYEQSAGATLEHDYARTVGLEIMLEESTPLTIIKLDRVIDPKAIQRASEALKKVGEAVKKGSEVEGLKFSCGKVVRCTAPKVDDFLLRYLTISEKVDAKAVLDKEDVGKVKKLLLKDKPRAVVHDCGADLCPHCGSDVSEDDEYCCQCGQHLS